MIVAAAMVKATVTERNADSTIEGSFALRGGLSRNSFCVDRASNSCDLLASKKLLIELSRGEGRSSGELTEK